MPRKKTDYSVFKFAKGQDGQYIVPEDFLDRHIPLVNPDTSEKRFGTSAPLGQALNEYLSTRPAFVVLDSEEKNVKEDRIMMWDSAKCRKISGKSAPLRKNLERYLSLHSNMQIYVDQKRPEFDENDPNEPVDIWDPVAKCRVKGNARPLRRDLVQYFEKHPNFEIYGKQNKGKKRCGAETVQSSKEGFENGDQEEFNCADPALDPPVAVPDVRVDVTPQWGDHVKVPGPNWEAIRMVEADFLKWFKGQSSGDEAGPYCR